MDKETLGRGLYRQYPLETDNYMIATYLYAITSGAHTQESPKCTQEFANLFLGKEPNANTIVEKSKAGALISCILMNFSRGVAPFNLFPAESFPTLIREGTRVKRTFVNIYKWFKNPEVKITIVFYMGIAATEMSGLFLKYTITTNINNDDFAIDAMIKDVCQIFDFKMEPKAMKSLKNDIIFSLSQK